MATRLQQLEEDSKSEEPVKKERAKQLTDEYLSNLALRKLSKPCPHCRAPIEKFAGCVQTLSAFICANSQYFQI